MRSSDEALNFGENANLRRNYGLFTPLRRPAKVTPFAGRERCRVSKKAPQATFFQ
jgi:hypothetical protein